MKILPVSGGNSNDAFSFKRKPTQKEFRIYSAAVKKGLKVLEVSKMENVLDVNIEKVEEDNEHIFLRANTDGKPEETTQTINGITYKAIKVADKIYIPNIENRI